MLETVSIAATFLLPLFLLHTRALAEIAIDATALCFLLSAIEARRWAWARQDWVILGLSWWVWEVVCTLASGRGGAGLLIQAVIEVRFLVFAAALQHFVFASARVRRWFLIDLGVWTLYVAGQTLLQFVTGYNLFGIPRYADGSLTGPFTKPRGGTSFIRMLFPPLLAWSGKWLARRDLRSDAAAAGLVLGAVAVIVLIGQRMPLLLLLLGLLVGSLLLPRLRVIAIVSVLAGAALIGASAVIAPPTFYRLVTKFSDQMEHFPQSHYGQIAGRALNIAGQNPWTGLGYDGFQAGCSDPQYFRGWHWPQNPADDGGGLSMCVVHPHNHFLQALDNGGVPGLLLFCALVFCWLRRLGRGLWRQPDPLRVGLFAAAIISEWPIASTSPIISIPIGAWFFLLLGFGLAVADAADASQRT